MRGRLVVAVVAVALVVVAVAVVSGGGGEDSSSGGDRSAGDRGSTGGPERPLEDAWYQDPDGDFRPTAIEERLGTDPESNECLRAIRCPLISPETGLPREPPQRNTLLMLDASGSMAGPAGGGVSKIEAARDSLAGFVAGAPGSLRAGFTVFGHRGSNRPSGRRVSCASAEVVEPVGGVVPGRFSRTLSRFEPTGYTPLGRALSRAPAAFADVAEGARNRIVLVTDGIETCGGDPVAEARKLKRAGIAVTVDVVGFDIARAADRERLRRIAEASGGRYTDARTASALQDYFDGLRRREDQLLETVNCVTGASGRIRNCSARLTSEASLAISDLQSAADAPERADALLEVKTEMSDSDRAWRARYEREAKRVADRLRREREETTDRLQGRVSPSPGARLARLSRPCPASALRTWVQPSNDTLWLARLDSSELAAG